MRQALDTLLSAGTCWPRSSTPRRCSTSPTCCGWRRCWATTAARRASAAAEGKLSAEEADEWPLTGELWALGVLETIELFADDWVAPPEDDEDAAWYDGSLRAIEALTQRDAAMLAADLALRYPGQQLSRDELVDEACLALQDLRCYWVDHAPRHAPRRVEPHAGPQRPLPLRQRQEVQEVPRRRRRHALS